MITDTKLTREADGSYTVVTTVTGLLLEAAPPPVDPPVDPDPPVEPDPPVDPGPVEPPPADYEAFKVFGEDAVTWTHFNKVGNLLWKNPGGDWIDAAGVKQGNLPIASAAVNVTATPQWIELDVTAFAKRWLSGTNDGMLLRSNGGKANYATRQAPDEALRPYMLVVTGTGEFECPCAGDVAMADSTSKSQGSLPSASYGVGLMRFDMSAVTGDVVLAVAYLYTPKQYGSHFLQAFQIDAPVPFDIGAQRIEGLAAAYQNDEGIEAHPDVIKTWDWPTGWETSQGLTSVKKDRDFVSLEVDGRWWLEVKMPVDSTCSGGGEGTGLSVQYELSTTPATINPIPMEPTYPLEAFFRYSVRLGEDWTSVDDPQLTGGKFPGFSGRFGYPRPSQGAYYWQSTGANGGVPGQGKYRPVSQYDRYANFRGWSARSQWQAEAQGQHDNPMRGVTPLGAYLYHPLWTKEGTGDVRMWRNAMLVPGREYDIEIHVKMNSIVGPFDEYGNGVAVPDGVYETFIDGIPTERDDKFIWRRHPYLGVEAAWYLFKNGGTLSPCKPHTVYAGPAVVARSYIGPRRKLVVDPEPDPDPVEPEPDPDPVEPPPGQDTALSMAARDVPPGACVEFPSPSLVLPDSSGSPPFAAPPGSGGQDIMDWASVMDLDPVTRRFYVSGGRPYTEPLAQKMIWYSALADKWDSRGNWSGATGGHIYRATCVAPELRRVFAMPYGSRLHQWDIDTDTYLGTLPSPPSSIGGKTSAWSPVKCLMWHPRLGAQGSLVMANNSFDRVVRFDWATQKWLSVATFGEIWANQHFTGHYLPGADAVICGHSYAATPAPLALVYADGTYRLTAPAPCNVSCGGGDGGPFVPHPTRATSIAFCQATHRIWSYEHDTDEWIDRGPIPAAIDRLNIIGGTAEGVVFVASNKTVHLYKPDF